MRDVRGLVEPRREELRLELFVAVEFRLDLKLIDNMRRLVIHE